MISDIVNLVESKFLKKNIPQLRAGDIIKVYQKIKEGGKERIQIFEGIIIRLLGSKGMNGSFTVRRVSFGIGIETGESFIHWTNVESVDFYELEKSYFFAVFFGKLFFDPKRKMGRLCGINICVIKPLFTCLISLFFCDVFIRNHLSQNFFLPILCKFRMGSEWRIGGGSLWQSCQKSRLGET